MLPRSTGLLFSLRTLAPFVPDLHVLDVTIGYPGIPPAGYGQSWYTIRSVFLDRLPPPEVHLHLRLYQVQRDIPIGNVGAAGDGNVGRGADTSDEEKATFDKWLTQLWREKDDLLEAFYTDGRFWSGAKVPAGSTAEIKVDGDAKTLKGADAVVVPIELRSWTEIPHAFCCFAPTVAVSVYMRVRALLGAR